jgi:hypothetical protein
MEGEEEKMKGRGGREDEGEGRKRRGRGRRYRNVERQGKGRQECGKVIRDKGKGKNCFSKSCKIVIHGLVVNGKIYVK